MFDTLIKMEFKNHSQIDFKCGT